jgi:hypothetical protein
LTHQLKKLKEKIQRLQARFFPLAQLAIDQPLDKLPAITINKWNIKPKLTIIKNRRQIY